MLFSNPQEPLNNSLCAVPDGALGDFGMVDFSVLSSAGWFQIPKPMEFGMKFEISAIIPLAILFLVNSIHEEK